MSVLLVRMELVTNLREGLERVCTEAAEILRSYNDFEVKLRQACRELDDEKMAREHAEKRIAELELAVEAAAKDLKLEKLRLQGAKEQILLRESQLRAFHSTVTEIAKVQHWQQDQLSKMLQTFEIGNSYNDHDNTNVQNTTSPSTIIRPDPLQQHTSEHQSSKRHRSTSQSTTRSKSAGSWTMATSATAHEENHDYRKEVIRRTSGEGAGEGHAEENFAYNEGIVSNDVDCNVHTWLDSEPETLRGMISSPENLHFKWGILDLEKDVESFGQDLLLSEELPILLMEDNLDYEGHEDPQHHSALRWRKGDMATIIAELRASESFYLAS